MFRPPGSAAASPIATVATSPSSRRRHASSGVDLIEAVAIEPSRRQSAVTRGLSQCLLNPFAHDGGLGIWVIRRCAHASSRRGRALAAHAARPADVAGHGHEPGLVHLAVGSKDHCWRIAGRRWARESAALRNHSGCAGERHRQVAQLRRPPFQRPNGLSYCPLAPAAEQRRTSF